MERIKHRSITFAITVLLIVFGGLPATAGEELFPMPPSISANVTFWQNIYAKYTSKQGILHDRNNLAIVYTVIDFVDWGTPGSARINRELIKLARHRYKAILQHLGKGNKPRNDEERNVVALFPKQRHTTYLKARENIRLQIGQKDRFIEGVKRSGKYIGTIKRILAAQGLPTDLAYLPHVESSYNPGARSKAGATGLWQFTRTTGLEYMTINTMLDERLDPFVSTHAAAKMLKENFAQLGTWPLAITAYNYGRAGMVRAVRSQKTYENIFNHHREGWFKFASRNFYPEFLAARSVARQLEKDPTVVLDRPEGTTTVRLKGYAASDRLRSHFSVSQHDFTRLNPGLLDPVLLGEKYVPKGYLLRLPGTKKVRNQVATMGSKLYHRGQAPDNYYTVQQGDTAGKIARKYKLSLKQLKDANNLDQHLSLRAGQKLTIPGRKNTLTILKAQSKRAP